MRSSLADRIAPAILALVMLVSWQRAAAAENALDLKVVQVARSVDFARNRQEFLTVTIEVAGAEPAVLRHVQPLRDDFRLLAGKKTLPCRWLQGGSIPEEDRKLRFTLGFDLPPRGVHAVSLRANLPAPQEAGSAPLVLNLDKLSLGRKEQVRTGVDWEIRIGEFAEQEYTPPSLAAGGVHFTKGGPVDIRIYRKEDPAAKPPGRAYILSFFSHNLNLYDPTLDVTGHLEVEGQPPAPLLSARMTRNPSRGVKDPSFAPVVNGQFFFALPEKGQPRGAVIQLIRRSASPPSPPIVVPDLPVPGR